MGSRYIAMHRTRRATMDKEPATSRWLQRMQVPSRLTLTFNQRNFPSHVVHQCTIWETMRLTPPWGTAAHQPFTMTPASRLTTRIRQSMSRIFTATTAASVWDWRTHTYQRRIHKLSNMASINHHGTTLNHRLTLMSPSRLPWPAPLCALSQANRAGVGALDQCRARAQD